MSKMPNIVQWMEPVVGDIDTLSLIKGLKVHYNGPADKPMAKIALKTNDNKPVEITQLKFKTTGAKRYKLVISPQQQAGGVSIGLLYMYNWYFPMVVFKFQIT